MSHHVAIVNSIWVSAITRPCVVGQAVSHVMRSYAGAQDYLWTPQAMLVVVKGIHTYTYTYTHPQTHTHMELVYAILCVVSVTRAQSHQCQHGYVFFKHL